MIIVKVVLPFPIRKYFKYFVPHLMYPIVGGRILVPFNSKNIVGIVIDVYEKNDKSHVNLKYVKALIDNTSLYNKIILEMLIWISKNYHCPIGKLFFSVLPKCLHSNYIPKEAYILKWNITKKGRELDLNNLKNRKKQLHAVLLLKEHSISSTELKKYKLSTFILKKLEHQELCKISMDYDISVQDRCDLQIKKKIFLNKQILIVINNILNKKYFTSWLLTKINLYIKVKFYLGLIQTVLYKEMQILIVVPYIKNINVILVLLKKYFNVSITIFHSELTNREYSQVWFQTKNGNISIVIGTNKSIFLPFFNLGLIIILEEHNLKYKNTNQCRYNFKDLGILRASKENIPVILDSETPSLKTLYNILYKKCFYIDLPQYIQMNKYNYNIINLNKEKTRFRLSLTLIEEIYKNFKKKQILLIFHKLNLLFCVLTCNQCNLIFKCIFCKDDFEINEYHNVLFCTFCLIKIEKPRVCYNCGNIKLVVKNINLEQIKNKIKNIFPDIPIFFLLNKNKTNNNTFKLALPNPYIIISTEDIVENYYFPNVSLISFICIDHHYRTLHFRTVEHFSQFYINLNQLTRMKQKSFKIFIQTLLPYDLNLKKIYDNRYHDFSKKLLSLRKIFLLPPWSIQVIIYSESSQSDNNIVFLNLLRSILKTQSNQYNIFLWLIGPHNSFIFKKKKTCLNQLLVQCSSRLALNYILNKSIDIVSIFAISQRVKWFIDIEPN